jgi:small-conductance mechanosensitive channel
MMLNVGLETLVGLVPFAGALFDMAYKANERNVALIEADLADRKATKRSSLAVLGVTLVVMLVAVLMLVAAMALAVVITVWMVRWFLGLF